MNFLIKEYSQENLEFLLIVIEYHTFAYPYYQKRGYFSGPEGASTEDIALILKSLKGKCIRIAETFIFNNAPKELNISDVQRKVVMNYLDKDDYNPAIWKNIFFSISVVLAQDKLNKFFAESRNK